MLSTDQRIFEENSEVRQRMADFGSVFDELRIIVYTRGNLYKKTAIAGNVFVYSTNTKFKPFYFFDVYKIAKSLITNGQLSVISCQDPFETGFAGWLLKLRFKIPFQIQVHTDLFSPYFWRESFKNKLRVLLAKFLLPRADGIRVVSERIKQSLKSNVKCQMSNVFVLPVFIDIQKIKNEKIRTDLHKKYFDYDFIILMASRLTGEKNIGMAVGVMSEIVKKYPKALLLIVGDGPERGALQKSIVKSRLLNVVIEHWTDDLISYYKTADLFLFTSNYEGYGRTVVEAMAAGLPVIMTNVGLAGDILKDNLNGLIVPINNLGELKRGIRILMDDKEKRKDISRKSIETVGNFPIKKNYFEKYRNSLNLKSVA